MNLWAEIALKGLVLFATLLAFLGSLALAFVAILGNGSAVGSDEFSWSFAMLTLAIVASQFSLTIAGCSKALKSVDDWSLEIIDRRSAAK